MLAYIFPTNLLSILCHEVNLFQYPELLHQLSTHSYRRWMDTFENSVDINEHWLTAPYSWISNRTHWIQIVTNLSELFVIENEIIKLTKPICVLCELNCRVISIPVRRNQFRCHTFWSSIEAETVRSKH